MKNWILGLIFLLILTVGVVPASGMTYQQLISSDSNPSSVLTSVVKITFFGLVDLQSFSNETTDRISFDIKSPPLPFGITTHLFLVDSSVYQIALKLNSHLYKIWDITPATRHLLSRSDLSDEASPSFLFQ